MNRSKPSRLACLALVGCCAAASALATNPPDAQAAPAQNSVNNVAMAPKAQAPSEPAVDAGTAAANTVNYQGVMVSIDPATGRLREPTAEEREKLAAAIRQQGAASVSAGSTSPPLNEEQARATLRRRTKGPPGLSMQLPMSRESYLMVDRKADGSLDIHHDDDKKLQSVKVVEQ